MHQLLILFSWAQIYTAILVIFIFLFAFFLFLKKRKNVSSSIILMRFFYISLIIELFVTPLRGVHIALCSLVGFILFFLYSFYCLKRFSSIDSNKCLFAILLGCLVLTLPVRIFNFERTLITLPDFTIHILGIIAGYFFYKLDGVKRLSLLLASILLCLLIFPGFNKWHFYLTFNSFTGLINEKINYPLTLIDQTRDTILYTPDKNKIYVWDFWTTSCGSCFKQFPELQKLYEQYKNDNKIEFCAINWPLQKNISTHNVFEIITNHGYTFPVAILSAPDDIYNQLGIHRVPTVLIVKNRTIIYRGNLSSSINIIKRYLKKNSCESQ